MKIIDKRLKETAEIIDRVFLKVGEQNRPEISSDILPHLRHFCEAFMYKVYDESENTYKRNISMCGDSILGWMPASGTWISARCNPRHWS